MAENEIKRPRDGCKTYIDSRLKGYIITNIFSVFAIIIAFNSKIDKQNLEFTKTTTKLEVSTAKLETIVNIIQSEKTVGTLFKEADCDIAQYQRYTDYLGYKRTAYR